MVVMTRPRNQANGFTAVLFFASLILGIFAILFLKIVGAHQVIVTLAPVGIMLVYAGAVYSIRKLRLRLDQAGDNLYYLGFLYTLTSLAYSLYEFGSSEGGTASIITNFGIAIWTTITGLALRVFFSQMRMDPVETEHLARVELADASRHLRVELDEAAREFSMFRRSLQQMTDEAFQDLQKSLDEALQGGLLKFENNVEQFSSAVAVANEGFEGRSDALKESADKLVGNMATLAGRIDAVQVSEDVLVRQLQPAMDKIEGTAQRLSSSVAHLSDRINSINISEDVFTNQLQPAINKIDDSAQQLGFTVTNLSERLNSINVSDDLFISKLQPAIDKISDAAEIAFKNANQDSVRAEAWADLASEVSHVTNGINEALSGTKDSSKLFIEGANSIETAALKMTALADSFNSMDAKVGSILKETDKELKQVIKTVVENLGGLSDQLLLQAQKTSRAISIDANTKDQETLETIPVKEAEKKVGKGLFGLGNSFRSGN
jgi:methyl-accepting chemotaxis protein